MSQVLLWLLLVVTLPLQTCRGDKSQGYNEDTRETSNKGKTMEDLKKQSDCQPRESLINVYDEFPDEIQYTIVPHCVPLQRCLGCCTDEEQMCMPKRTETVNLEVFRTYSNGTSEIIKLPFLKHTRCQCRHQKKSNN
ncbi:vascular endothelial growth factor A [Ictalurus punctatus]|uniref:Vascular endothelial growth factor A n=1 Tax=Ictalurus punctatus TaxID=7998 RepID=A0A2D0T1E4_ICTPU|nr:vascular endothelial growth factor A [Ictalurus punctatus]